MSHTDQPSSSWVLRLPATLQPYALLMRLDRPIGIYLLFWPAAWGILLGHGALSWAAIEADNSVLLPLLSMLGLFAVGAILMRGAGCAINDLWDRKIDAAVARTKNRPLASGRIKPRQAVIFICILLLLSLLILMRLPTPAIIAGFLVVGLILIYPAMKRITWWPQVFLGVTFNWGVFMGWLAMNPRLSPVPLLVYFAALFWTLGYDTIYAHQDKKDDAKLGLKSTALKLGKNSKKFVALCYAFCISLLWFAGLLHQLNGFYFVVLTAVAAHFIYQLAYWQPDNPQNCLFIFKHNHYTGALIFIACVLGVVV